MACAETALQTNFPGMFSDHTQEDSMEEKRLSTHSSRNNSLRSLYDKGWCRLPTCLMEPGFGLEDRLLASGTVSRQQCADNNKHYMLSDRERNEQIIDHCIKTHKTKELAQALRETNQGHLVNYVENNGEYDPNYGGNWPLTEKETQILDCNHADLIDGLDMTDLLPQLYSKSVINRRHYEFVLSKSTESEKNRAFLDILYRRSLADYRMTIRCLQESCQARIAILLEAGSSVMDPVRYLVC